MKVQRIRLPETDQLSWIVLDDDYVPIQPILTYLTFLNDLEQSPYTRRSVAHHLKLFWEYLRDQRICWTDIDVAHLAAFIQWLRRPNPAVLPAREFKARRTDGTIDQYLSSVQKFYEFHMRLKTIPRFPLYTTLYTPHRRYKSFLHGISKSKPVQSRLVKVKRERRAIKVVTKEQVSQLIDACSHVRDAFLLTLLFQTGCRIGQALGLRHEDIRVEDNELHIVPRENNANAARAKTRSAYVIPALSTELLQLYTRYLVEELSALDTDRLPDYVFVNLWDGDIGRPMTYDAVMSLFRRLRKKTGIRVAPHMLRHTRATTWIREDKLPLATVSRLLGHSSIQTTHSIYVHLTPQDLKRDLDAVRLQKEH